MPARSAGEEPKHARLYRLVATMIIARVTPLKNIHTDGGVCVESEVSSPPRGRWRVALTMYEDVGYFSSIRVSGSTLIAACRDDADIEDLTAAIDARIERANLASAVADSIYRVPRSRRG